MLHWFRTFKNLKDFEIESLVPKLCSFCQMGGFCLLVKGHWGGSATNGDTPSSFFVLIVTRREGTTRASAAGQTFFGPLGKNNLFMLFLLI